jgi:hypothetical protein
LARRVLTLCAASWSLTARRRPSAWLRSDKVQPRTANETAADDPTRELFQQRFDEIDDALRDVNAERARLKNFSVP